MSTQPPPHTRSPISSSLGLSKQPPPPRSDLAPRPMGFVTDSRPADFNQDDSDPHGAVPSFAPHVQPHQAATAFKLSPPHAPAAAVHVRRSASFSIEGEASPFTISHDEPYQAFESSGILSDRLTVTIDRPAPRLPQPIGRAPDDNPPGPRWATPPSMALPLESRVEPEPDAPPRPATPLVPVLLTVPREDAIEDQQASSATHPAHTGLLASDVSTSTIPVGAVLGPRAITGEECVSVRGVGTETTPDFSGPQGLSGALPPRRHKPVVLSKKVEIDNRNIFINGLTADIDDAKLKEMFAVFGEIQSSRVLVNSRTGRHKGIGFVFYRDPEGARRAIEAMNDAKMRESWNLIVKYADEAAAFAPELSNKLFIRNVPTHVSSATLKEFFGQHGDVVDCHVRPDVSSQGRREGSALQMAYVTFRTIDEASDALSATHATSPFGAHLPALQVKFAETLECRNQRKQRSGQPASAVIPSPDDRRPEPPLHSSAGGGLLPMPFQPTPLPYARHTDAAAGAVPPFLGSRPVGHDVSNVVAGLPGPHGQGALYTFPGPQPTAFHPSAHMVASPPAAVSLPPSPSVPVGYTYAVPGHQPYPPSVATPPPPMQPSMPVYPAPQQQPYAQHWVSAGSVPPMGYPISVGATSAYGPSMTAAGGAPVFASMPPHPTSGYGPSIPQGLPAGSAGYAYSTGAPQAFPQQGAVPPSIYLRWVQGPR